MGKELPVFLLANTLGLEKRLIALGGAWAVGALLALALFLLLRRFGDRGQQLSMAATCLAPFVVAVFVPLLFSREAWVDRELTYLCVVLAVGLAFERLLRPFYTLLCQWRLPDFMGRWLARPGVARFGRAVPLLVVVGLALYYALRIGHLTNVSHFKMTTMSSDLAEYDNMFFNALSGHPFRSPAIAGHRADFSSLQGHAEFGLYFLLPFYAISPGAHALLWIQSGVVALTAIPLYLLGAARISRWGGLVFAFAFLMMPAVQRPNFYDFHFTPLGMLFVAWLLFFVSHVERHPEQKAAKWGLYLSLCAALLAREDVSIGIVVLGAFLVLSGVMVRQGLILASVAGTYFFAMKFGIMPLFGKWWFDNMYDDLKAEGAGGFGAVILTLVSNPAYVLRTMLTEPKFLYCLHMTAPVLALWLRRPLLWMAVLPGMLATLLVTNRPPMYQSSFQYTYLWLPYVMGASILAAGRGARGSSAATSLLLVALSVGYQMGVLTGGDRILGGFRQKTFEVSEAEETQMQNLREIVEMIPRSASVSATEAEGPHVSNRLLMYSLKYFPGHDPDYILAGHVGIRGEKAHIRTLLETGAYGVIAQRGHFVLAKKGADTKDNGVLWRRAGGPPRPASKRAPTAPRRPSPRPDPPASRAAAPPPKAPAPPAGRH